MTIDVPGATNTDAHGINASGQIVGDYTDGSGNVAEGFLLSGGSLTAVNDPTAPGPSTFATGINGSGQIVGYAFIGAWHGFLDNSGTFTTINAPEGGYTFLEGVNDATQIVGYRYPSPGLRLPAVVTSFVYNGGSFTSVRDPQEVRPTINPGPMGERLRRASTMPARSSAITLAPASRFTASSAAAAPTRRSMIRSAPAAPTRPASTTSDRSSDISLTSTAASTDSSIAAAPTPPSTTRRRPAAPTSMASTTSDRSSVPGSTPATIGMGLSARCRTRRRLPAPRPT
jgi:hypothetical protein